MKISKLISYSAFAIIASFLIISSASIYFSTTETANSIDGVVKYVNIGSPQPYIGFCLMGNAKGVIPSSISIMNQTITLNPGENISKLLNLPINISSMTEKGFPFSSMSLFISDAVYGALFLMNFTAYKGGFSMNIPAIFSNITSTKVTTANESSGQAFLSLGFRVLIPLFFQASRMLIYDGPSLIGNFSLQNYSGIFNKGNVNLSGIIHIPEGQSINSVLKNLVFSMNGLKWSAS
jgi:hypothetical protein